MAPRAFLAVILFSAACGGGPATIDVLSARQAGGFPDPIDNMLQLEVQLTNTSQSSLPLDPQRFSVKTRSGLLVSALPFTPALRFSLGNAQPPAASLAPGARFSFGLAFDTVPGDVTEVEFVYGAGSPARAKVVVEQCEPCGDACTYLSLDLQRCCDGPTPIGGTCVDHRGVCSQGKTICGDATQRTCVDLTRDSKNCGACGVKVPGNGYCQQGHPVCTVGNPTTCTGTSPLGPVSYCTDLTRDPNSCGACGHSCNGELDACWAGRCAGTASNPGKVNCTYRCQQLGATCSDANGYLCGHASFKPELGSGSCGALIAHDYDFTHVPGGGSKGTAWEAIPCNKTPPQFEDYYSCVCVQ